MLFLPPHLRSLSKQASKQVAFAWATTLGPEEGAQLLKKLGLLEPAIEFATESGAFDQVGHRWWCFAVCFIS